MAHARESSHCTRIARLFGEEYATAVGRAIEYVLGAKKHESVGYVLPVLSCNEFGVVQERILVLTNRRLYRVKFDFNSKKIVRYSTTELNDVVCTYCGELYEGLVSFGECAVKVVSRTQDGGRNLAEHRFVNSGNVVGKDGAPVTLFSRVYKSLLPPRFGRIFCEELAAVISAVAKRKMFLEEVRWCHLGGPIAPVLNYFNIGRWNQRITDREAMDIAKRLKDMLEENKKSEHDAVVAERWGEFLASSSSVKVNQKNACEEQNVATAAAEKLNASPTSVQSDVLCASAIGAPLSTAPTESPAVFVSEKERKCVDAPPICKMVSEN